MPCHRLSYAHKAKQAKAPASGPPLTLEQLCTRNSTTPAHEVTQQLVYSVGFPWPSKRLANCLRLRCSASLTSPSLSGAAPGVGSGMSPEAVAGRPLAPSFRNLQGLAGGPPLWVQSGPPVVCVSTSMLDPFSCCRHTSTAVNELPLPLSCASLQEPFLVLHLRCDVYGRRRSTFGSPSEAVFGGPRLRHLLQELHVLHFGDLAAAAPLCSALQWAPLSGPPPLSLGPARQAPTPPTRGTSDGSVHTLQESWLAGWQVPQWCCQRPRPEEPAAPVPVSSALHPGLHPDSASTTFSTCCDTGFSRITFNSMGRRIDIRTSLPGVPTT